jgi:uncharacterized membrane protein
MRLFGHPVHPMLVHFPIAFWSLGTVCDGLALIGIDAAWPQAWLFLAIGTAAAVPAMIAGLTDFAGLEESSVPIGVRHLLLMATAWSGYLTAFVMHSDGWAPSGGPSLPAIAVSAASFMLTAAGGHTGGRLVYQLGAGLERSGRGEDAGIHLRGAEPGPDSRSTKPITSATAR